MPRVLLERSYSLRDVLQTLDITQVFQDDADITNMGGAKGPKLTQVSFRGKYSSFQRQQLSLYADDIHFFYLKT